MVNAQVDAGAALLRVDPAGDDGEEVVGERVTLPGADAAPAAADASRARDVLAAMRALITGFDVTAEHGRQLVSEYETARGGLPVDDPELLHGELALLTTFADLSELSRNRPTSAEEQSDEQVHSPREHFHTYLHSLDIDREALPESFRARLSRALLHYGVAALEPGPALEEAVFRIFLAQQRTADQLPVVLALLDRWLTAEQLPAGPLRDELAEVLDRLIVATQLRYPSVGDVARAVRFRYFEKPLVEQARQEVVDQAERLLAELTESGGAAAATGMGGAGAGGEPGAADPAPGTAPRRAADLGRGPRPRGPHPPVLPPAQPGEPAVVRARRAHRRRGRLRAERGTAASGGPDGAERHPAGRTLLTGGARGGDPRPVARRGGPLPLLAGPADRRRRAGRPAARAAVGFEVLRSGRRVTVTVVHPRRRRRDPDLPARRGGRWRGPGLAEDVIIRGMHPLTAQRLDLWRLKNFSGVRLPSAEDTYLLHVVAKENPNDERLIAMAEVRDATPLTNAAGEVVGFPTVERLLTACLDSLRRARAPRERPAPRPQPDLPVRLAVHRAAADTAGHVRALVAPLTVGAGLDEIVILGRLQEEPGVQPRDVALRFSNTPGHRRRTTGDRPADRADAPAGRLHPEGAPVARPRPRLPVRARAAGGRAERAPSSSTTSTPTAGWYRSTGRPGTNTRASSSGW